MKSTPSPIGRGSKNLPWHRPLAIPALLEASLDHFAARAEPAALRDPGQVMEKLSRFGLLMIVHEHHDQRA